MSWIKYTNPNNVYVQRFNADGSKLGGETQVNTDANFADREGAPSVAALSGGKFVVSWIRYADNNNVYVQRFNADGSKPDDETQVNTNANFADRSSAPSVAALSGGKFVVSWIRYVNPPYVYVRIDDGPSVGSVSGYAKDETDTGIEGITIQLKSGALVVDSTTTGVDGSYTFSDVDPDDYTVVAGNKTWYRITSSQSVPVTVTAGQTSTANFEYQRLGQITINTLNEIGAAVPNVSFTFVGTDDTISSQTDASGNFSQEVAIGAFDLTITTPNWYRATSDTSVTGTTSFSSTTTENFTYQRLGQLVITTRTQAGEVVPNVSFSFVGGETVASQTDANGNYSAQLAVGSFTLTLQNPSGYEAVSNPVQTGALAFQQTTSIAVNYQSVVTPQDNNRARILAPFQCIPLRFIETANEFYTQLRTKVNAF